MFVKLNSIAKPEVSLIQCNILAIEFEFICQSSVSFKIRAVSERVKHANALSLKSASVIFFHSLTYFDKVILYVPSSLFAQEVNRKEVCGKMNNGIKKGDILKTL
ncbi:MAG: hypothetical protein LBB39_03170 [Mycoplasmataceae bacterium]|jgi:hypothetical protein|nr:hypothetical protein [Mycoplasmataceae bacterium]